MKRIYWIIIAVVIIGAIFYFFQKGKSAISYETNPVEKGNISSVVTGSGKLQAEISVDIGCQVTGKIQKIYVDYNNRVKKGQLLAEIDPTLLTATYNSSLAVLNQQEENLKKAGLDLNNKRVDIARMNNLSQKYEAILTDKKRTLDRYSTLLVKNLISQSDKDTAETNYISALKDYKDSGSQLTQAKTSVTIAEASYKVAQDVVKKSQIDLQKAQADLNYTKIISPIDGIITAKLMEEGQTVVSTYQTSTLFKVANNLAEMQILCEISESDIANVKVGQKATFNVDAYPGKDFEGKVKQIRINPQEVDKAVYYNVVIDVNNKDFKLIPGMTAQVNIITLYKDNVLKVSDKALRFIPKLKESQDKLKKLRMQESGLKREEGQTIGVLWVMNKKEINPLNVVLGISDGKNTEIAAGPLKEKDLVVIGEKEKKK